jgi:transcriptional regulator GlxA family with amidase domain
VRKDFGADVARVIAQDLVAAPHRDGNQAQLIARPVEVNGSGPIAKLCQQLTVTAGEHVTLEHVATQCPMSSRTFTRHFRAVTGTTPLQWLLTLRMDEARRLLERTDLSIDEVAERAGFGTALNLRTHFRRRLDTTPTAYRRTFSSPTDLANALRHGEGASDAAPKPVRSVRGRRRAG